MRHVAIVLIGLLFVAPASGKTLSATPETVADVFNQARFDNEVTAIELAPGVYSPDELMLRDNDRVEAADLVVLTIRPAKAGTVTFDGGRAITEAEALGGGVYRVAGKTAAMWEADTRTRYVHVADRRTVDVAPGTFAMEGESIVFHTSDGGAPASHDLGMAVHPMGMRIMRPKTVIRGIAFRNYLASTWAAGIYVNASNVTVRDCSMINARCAFFVYGDLQNAAIEDCRAQDVGCAIYAMGKDMRIHRNHFIKRRDSYQVPTYWQDDNGIQCYYPADGGVITGNVVIGFNYGIYCKCRGQWRVEHNTVIDSKGGLYRSGWKAGNVYRYNIVSGSQWPFHNPQTMHAPVEVDHNLLWDPRELVLFHGSLDGPASVGNKHNVIANPRFVDPTRGDYRLLSGSPAIALSQDDKPLGALPVVEDHTDDQPPVVTLSLLGAAKRGGAVGEELFLRDPWIGGGRQRKGEQFAGGDVDYIVPSPKIDLVIDATDASGALGEMQLRFNEDDWQDATPLNTRPDKLKLPRGGVNTLAVRVSDETGNWSQPATLRIRVADSAPDLDGDVTVYASDHGVVLSFRTDQPALATVEYDGGEARQPRRVTHDWDVMAGGDNVVEWTEPRAVHHVPILAPDVDSGQAYGYRIRLTDAVGNERVTDSGSFTVAGAARTLRVGPGGKDEDGAAKFATIQYAVDRALPNDTVIVEPGVYIEETFVGHGGLPGAPITLRGEDGAVLDGARKLTALLRVDNAPHVHIDNLELRWVTLRGSAIYAVDSPGLTVRNCKIWNKHFGNEWGEGYAVFTHRCANTTFDRNLIFRQEVGLYLLQSPGATITRNTGVQCLLGGVMLSVGSAVGTTVTHNSITFNGNDQMYIETLDPSEVETFTSDYNNFATQLRQSNEGGDMSVTAPHPWLKASSKAIIMGPLGRYRDMDSWRAAHGQDKHSLFADPRYVDPINHDFRLQPDSPNVEADIGAFGVKK